MLTRLLTAIRATVTPGSPGLMERLAAVPRMVGATLRGQYVGTSRWRLLALLGALLYVVSPVDLVPEGLLAFVGLADDAVVLAWMAAALVTDTEDYLVWERASRHSTVPSHVVG
jgi:uncharacterized membrane protein YkvA (DUF1232 family)